MGPSFLAAIEIASSVDPEAPAGLESNWIPTRGKTPYLWLRLYGPDEAFWNKSFKMPDVELVKFTRGVGDTPQSGQS